MDPLGEGVKMGGHISFLAMPVDSYISKDHLCQISSKLVHKVPLGGIVRPMVPIWPKPKPILPIWPKPKPKPMPKPMFHKIVICACNVLV